MSFKNSKCTNMQLLPSGHVSSNIGFFYKDETKYQDNHKIFIDDGFEKKIYLKYNNPIYHVNNFLPKKHVEPEIDSAFDKAIGESEKTKKLNVTKYEITQKKRELIKEIVIERNKLLKEKEESEKKKLEEILVRIIKDSLKFTKENSPIIAMIPNKITSAINEIKEKKSSNNKNIPLNANNVSLGNSFNISFMSNQSTNQARYESNAFLKALGLDLQNLTPETIKIDIDEAFNFIKKWKVTRNDINEIIRMKVVNEIMNVEERRSVQKLKKLNQKYEKYLEYKKNKEMLKNQISEKSSDDYDEENITNQQNLDTQNLMEEIKEYNKEENSNNILIVNQLNSNCNIENNKKVNQSKNDSVTFIGKSTNFTNKKSRENNSNLIESTQNVISSNLSNSNNFNNISYNSNLLSINQTIDKNNSLKNNNKTNFINNNNYSTIKKQNLTNNPNNISEAISAPQMKNTKKSTSSLSPGKRKVDYRLKLKPEIQPKKKRKLVLNSYKNIDKIMKIINNSDNLKSNENLCKHFRNIRYNKKIDDLTNKLLNLNKLTLEPFEEVEMDV